MVGKIFYSRYELISTQSLNAITKEVKREGALLKVVFDGGKVGYADCHAWPELGDLPLHDQLNKLAEGYQTALVRCALDFARLDAEGRSNGKRLLTTSLKEVKSHFLIHNLLSCSPNQVFDIERKGYTHVKIKLGRDIDREIEKLNSLFIGRNLKLRFDFNEKVSPVAFRFFLSRILDLKSQIDFIEDPFPYNYQGWKEVQDQGWVLACDREAAEAVDKPEAAQVLIIKPAINPASQWIQWRCQTKIVTSYLGHPISQAAAAYVAQEIDPACSSVHGLLSHHVYEPNSFSRQLNWDGPSFTPPAGRGFGFDRDLDALEWTFLTSI